MRSLKAPLKDYLRRRELVQGGIKPTLVINTWTAGERSGTWTVHPDPLGARSVVYSFGVGNNVGWELALIERFGLGVDAFDPTTRSVEWAGRQEFPDGFRFHPVALAKTDGTQRFHAPVKTRSLNFRPDPEGGHAFPAKRLSTLAAELGHERIDVLKIDIEGGEYDLIDELLSGGPQVDQLLIEFHHGMHGWTLSDTKTAMQKLQVAGFELFHVSRRGLEFSFLRRA